MIEIQLYCVAWFQGYLPNGFHPIPSPTIFVYQFLTRLSNETFSTKIFIVQSLLKYGCVLEWFKIKFKISEIAERFTNFSYNFRRFLCNIPVNLENIKMFSERHLFILIVQGCRDTYDFHTRLSCFFIHNLNPLNKNYDVQQTTQKTDGVFLDLRSSVLLPIRPTSTWFYAAPGPLACPSRCARPPSPS